MPGTCTVTGVNLGSRDCRFLWSITEAFGLTALYKEDGTKNFITKADAALLSNIQVLFELYNFSSDVLEKIVMTPIIDNVVSEQGDSTVYENGKFKMKTSDGVYEIKGMLEDTIPGLVDSFKEWEGMNAAIYLFDESAKIGGKETTLNLYPFAVDIAVKEYKLPTIDTPGQTEVTVTLKDSKDINKLNYVQVKDANGDDANINDQDQFYSLNDATGTSANVAVTGGIFTIAYDRYPDIPVTGILYTEWAFVETLTEVSTPLAAAGSVAEVSGVYTVNEPALLTTLLTYKVNVSSAGNDITIGNIVIP